MYVCVCACDDMTNDHQREIRLYDPMIYDADNVTILHETIS